MAFSKAFLDEVKDRNDIEELINRYVPLKRSGSVLKGICPFHSEKTPSFTVFPATQNYYCFGCGNGGDAVTFVMQTEGLDYPSAVEMLAKRAGVPMEEQSYSGERTVRKDRIIEATREAARFYHTLLSSDFGSVAREYIEKRDLQPLTVKRFGIGCAPDSWDMLYKHLKSLGFTLEEMRAAFLVGVAKNGNPYDVFRNRLMFPVFDLAGNAVAFSARRLNEADDRKYVNTSDTPAFKKSRILFALNFAKNTDDGSLILCEGAVDAVMLHQAGFRNACATLGTAITDDHARALSRIAKTIFLAYDIDSAGRAATDKAIGKLNEVGLSAKIISLGSDAKDPDEYIKKFGAESFRRRLNASEGKAEYAVNRILSKYNLTVPDEKSMAAREICAYLATLQSRTDVDIYAAMAAESLGVNRAMLTEDTERIRRRGAGRSKAKFDEKAIQEAQGFSDRTNRDKIRFSSAAAIEERILGMMLIRPDIAPAVCEKLSPDSFVTGFNKKVFSLFRADFEAGKAAVISGNGELTPDEISAVTRMMATCEEAGGVNDDVLNRLADKLIRMKEMNDAEQKITENPAEALEDYVNLLRKRKNADS